MKLIEREKYYNVGLQWLYLTYEQSFNDNTYKARVYFCFARKRGEPDHFQPRWVKVYTCPWEKSGTTSNYKLFAWFEIYYDWEMKEFEKLPFSDCYQAALKQIEKEENI